MNLSLPTHITPILATYGLWAVYFVSWSIAAFWAGPTLKQPIGPLALLDRVLFLAGFSLLFVLHVFGLYQRFGLSDAQDAARTYLTLPNAAAWVLAGVAGVGLILQWWARLHLGRLWSTMITRKEGHRIVDTGPYALVRHPIYTGLLLMVFATAAERATLFAYAGAGIMLVALLLRVWREERFLSKELGEDAYAAYRARVPALVPFVRF